MRSRAVSRPLACWRATRSSPPMSRASSWRRRSSSSSGSQLTGPGYAPGRAPGRVYSRRVARPRVILAETNEPVRIGLRAALVADGFEIAAEPTSTEEAVAAARQARPDLCLLDVELAGGG